MENFIKTTKFNNAQIAMMLKIHEKTVYFARAEIQQSRMITPKRRENIKKRVLRGKMDAEEIARVEDLDLDDVKAVIEKFFSREPIKDINQEELQPYYAENWEGYLPVYTLPKPFKFVSLSVDEDGKPLKREPESAAQVADLYKGKCSCNRPQNTKNLLIMGQAGSGKTSVIDTFLNYLLGVELCDKFRYKLTDEREMKNRKIAEQ